MLLKKIKEIKKLTFNSPPFFFFSYESRYEYRWADGQKVKKPIQVSAPEYIDLLMSWVEGNINDEALFPILPGIKLYIYNKNFLFDSLFIFNVYFIM